MTNPVKVLVCRVGRLPVVESLTCDEKGSFLDAMQAIVGGTIEVIVLDDGTELWSNEDGRMLDLPLNRVIPAAPRSPPTMFGEPVDIIYMDEGLAKPGEPGEWRIAGNFFLANSDEDGELVDVKEDIVKKYSTLFDSEDIEAARKFNERQTRGRR